MRWSTLFGLIGKFVCRKNVIAEQRQGSEAKNKYKEGTGLQSSQLGNGVEKLTTWVKLLNYDKVDQNYQFCKNRLCIPYDGLKIPKDK